MQYVTVAVASEIEAERLKQDLTENPGAPLLTPRWGNAVHATLAGEPAPPVGVSPASNHTAPDDSEADDSEAGPLGRSEATDRALIREAAVRATQVYPGPVGELLSRELLSWEQFGYRLGSHASIMRIVEQILSPYVATTERPRNGQVSGDAQVHAA